MADIKTAEIANQKGGSEQRSVSLTLRDDGSIQMRTDDVSKLAEEMWGKEDYEFWVTIAPTALPLLAFELLRERFAGDAGATDRLAEFCKANNIAHEWESYP